MIDENWLTEQNELLTVFSGAKHATLQMGLCSSKMVSASFVSYRDKLYTLDQFLAKSVISAKFILFPKRHGDFPDFSDK